MTPKEKAWLLYTDMWAITKNEYDSKQCAFTAVNEMLNQCWGYRDIDLQKSFDYWQEVKQEIEKL